jgi:ubiquinone/menaquinone biosynthesis C-methylase UbiE
MAERIQDQWARWLLQRRHGGDPQVQKAMLDELSHVRDTVLQNAQVAAGNTLLDVGAGDGLIAFGALPLVGEQGIVIVSDISQELLDHCHAIAARMGVLDRCRFLRASADDLSTLENASVDVVTTRSVLIYVPAKQRACEEFFRVLKPGGRLSICEPINRFAYPEPPYLFLGYDVTPVQDLAAKVKAVYERLQPPDTDPMLDFDERDLLTFVEKSGFGDIHLELLADITRTHPERWDTFLRQSGNPKIPTHEEALQEALSPAEAAQFAAHLRPLVEKGQGTRRMALAYIWAVKQAA